MDIERAINMAKGCVMASFMDSETKQMVIESLDQMVISEMETTSCEWCEAELSFEVVWHSFGSSFVDKAMFCPNCGRRLEEKNHGSKENN
jgi:hypothetical protein